MTTPRQIAANQANALKSTGPKTAEGIEKSSANAVKHGLTAAKIRDPLSHEELQASIERWIDENDAVTEYERQLAEIMAVETARCQDCRMRESELREREARRAETAWEIDRRAEVETLAKKLEAEPSATLAQLRRSSYGVRWLKTRWEGLLRALDEPEGWNEIERNLALDLVGTPLELRRGRTAVDPFPRGEVLEIARREAEANGLGDFGKSPQPQTSPIDPTDSDALKHLPALREEDPTLYRCGFVEAMIAYLNVEAERLDELDECDRRAALRKISPDVSRELKLLRRYEAAAFRKFQWARKEYSELCDALAEPPAFLGETAEPEAELAETVEMLRRLREDAQRKASQEVEPKPEPKPALVAAKVEAKVDSNPQPSVPAYPASVARSAIAGVRDAWLGFSALDRRERQPVASSPA